MFISKSDIISIINTEIDDGRPDEEIIGLNELKTKVQDEQPLTYQEYEWLCYLVYNSNRE